MSVTISKVMSSPSQTENGPEPSPSSGWLLSARLCDGELDSNATFCLFSPVPVPCGDCEAFEAKTDAPEPLRAFWAFVADGEGCLVGVFCIPPFQLLLDFAEACEVELGDLARGFLGLGVVKLIDSEELEAEEEWSKDICLRGGVKDMTRERGGGDSVECAEL
jgi:hypothetical protein